MAKKNKLPSGSVRVQRRWTDKQGKTHLKSFSAPTKAEAEALAAEWADKRGKLTDRLTVAEAVRRYIDIKEPVLSPATVRGYESLLRNYFGGTFGGTDLLTVTNTDMQVWVSDLSGKVKPKTVSNAVNLLTAAVGMFMPDFPIRLTLPQKVRPDLYCPSVEDVQAVINAAADPQVRAAVMLAAVGTMRRGEICALTWGDIHGSTISIRKALSINQHGAWVEKAPKTTDSARDVVVSDAVLNAVNALRSDSSKADDRILTYTPNELSNRFKTAVRRAGVQHFRFHDLRHFSASQMHLSGIPDKYIEARGGWRPGSTVMKTVYQSVIDLEKKRQDRKILEAFGAIGAGKSG